MLKGKKKRSPGVSPESEKSKRFKPVQYQLKIVLLNIDPPVWRRFLIPETISLHLLHRVVQIVMGWGDCHLHQFVFGPDIYADPEQEPDGEMGKMKNEHRVLVGDVLSRERSGMTYEYDFGDGWNHRVSVERVLPESDPSRPIVCLEGERACPPEDCGGFHGYAEILDIIFNPSHPDYEAMLDWTGRDFNPEVFDLEKVNRRLNELARAERLIRR